MYDIRYTVEYKPAGTWLALPANRVVSVDTTDSQSNDGVISFGDESSVDCTIQLIEGTINPPLPDTPVRVRFARNTTNVFKFVGVSDEPTRSYGTATMEVRCVGLAALIRKKKVYSPAWFRRPVATQTRVDSNTNPNDPAFSDGIINWILLQAGGWPAERDFDQPASSTFLFQCDQALLTPEWSWVAGDDAWEECKSFAAAAGGFLYQTQDGVIRFRQPFPTMTGATLYTFDESVYGDITETRSQSTIGNVFRCPYTPRAARPLQEVYNDTPYQVLPVGTTERFDLAPKFPLKSLDTIGASGQNLRAEALNLTYVDGGPVPYAPTAFTHTITHTAQSATLAITNTGNKPFIVNRIVLKGEPITSGEPGIASFGSGAIEREIPQNPNIQSASHAQRLCHLHHLFNDRSRFVYTLIDCPYDPNRVMGQLVRLKVAAWSVDSMCLITEIQLNDTGLRATYTVVSMDNVPQQDAYFLIGTTNYTGQTKRTGI